MPSIDAGFGITGLLVAFPPDRHDHGSPLDVLDSCMPDDLAALVVLRQDAVLLREKLSAAEIEALWVGAARVDSCPDETGEAWSGTRWMNLIVERCDRQLAGRSTRAGVLPGSSDRLKASVIKEISESGLCKEEQSLLTLCVRKCSSDLAFRFLLRMINAYFSDLPSVQYERYVELGRGFDYDESIVASLLHLVSDYRPLEFTDFDYGITGLASQFHEDWGHVGGPMDVVETTMRDDDDHAEVIALRNDAMLLLDGLESDEIERLWLASAYSGNFFGSRTFGITTGAQWMERIIERCDRRLASHSAPTSRIPGPGRQLASTVTAEVTEALSEHDLCAVLVKCVSECSPDLAFRFLLRVIGERRHRFSTTLYERYARLGEEFGYGEFVVSDVKYLTE
ncbi:hypothetical protein [Amycolatopsis sp. NPDC059657]|uniref:hypothetical protein n=1 Tax=Amycolatopsis sp. NPDC059657 TaxID=3346899 RepID=UPI00366FE22A